MIIFFGWLCTSIAVVPHIEIGLDQELSMPEDSFVLKYFQVIFQEKNNENLKCSILHCIMIFFAIVSSQLSINWTANVFRR